MGRRKIVIAPTYAWYRIWLKEQPNTDGFSFFTRFAQLRGRRFDEVVFIADPDGWSFESRAALHQELRVLELTQ